MRPLFRFLAALLFLSGYTSKSPAHETNSTVSASEVAAAIQTLKTTKILSDPDPYRGLGATNAVQNGQYSEIYSSQTNAIAVLGNAKVPGTADLLLPYLNYRAPYWKSLKVYWDGIWPVNHKEIARVWPALQALTEIPGSAKALSTYALDDKNPIDFRLAAFHALSYVDNQQFKVTGVAMLAEFPNSPRVKSAIKYIRSDIPPNPYIGTTLFEDISK